MGPDGGCRDTDVSPPERAAFARLLALPLTDAYRPHHPEPGRYTWWDYRGGNFHKNIGMRIDHLLVSDALVPRIAWIEIDRETRRAADAFGSRAPGDGSGQAGAAFRHRMAFPPAGSEIR